jgi:hypothetical protein
VEHIEYTIDRQRIPKMTAERQPSPQRTGSNSPRSGSYSSSTSYSSSGHAQDPESWFDAARKRRKKKYADVEAEDRRSSAEVQQRYDRRVRELNEGFSEYCEKQKGLSCAGRQFLVESFLTEYTAKLDSVWRADQQAIDKFREKILSRRAEQSKLMATAKRAMSKVNSAGFFALGKARKLMQGARLLWQKIPAVGKTVLERMAQVCNQATKFKDSETALANQISISLFADSVSGRTYVQISFGGDDGFCFLELPELLANPPSPERLLRSAKGAITALIGDRRPMVWVNGDYENVNTKNIVHGGPHFRVRDARSRKAAESMAKLLTAEPINSGNTEVLVGIPNSETQVQSVFGSDILDTPMLTRIWSEEFRRWSKYWSRSNALIPRKTASKKTVINALCSSSNVIIVVAHSNGESIIFPEPEPDGSVISKEDFLEHKNEISANAPVVYLMCCKSARVSATQSLTETLLEVGASAVYAPQQPIGSPLTLFKHFMRLAKKSCPAIAFSNAEKKARFWEIEVWIP